MTSDLFSVKDLAGNFYTAERYFRGYNGYLGEYIICKSLAYFKFSLKSRLGFSVQCAAIHQYRRNAISAAEFR